MTKIEEKEKAILLRRQGLSYREILKKVPVAKSSLSLWLREVGLTKKQKQRLTKKKLEAALRGAEIRKTERVERMKKIIKSARQELSRITKRELWLLGTMLYWAEGAKEKPYRVGQRVEMINNDPRLLIIFKHWLINCCNISSEDLIFDIYIHISAPNPEKKVKEYWRKHLSLHKNVPIRIYYKKHNPRPRRKNTKLDYWGAVRIKVKNSNDLNRKITGWTEGMYANIDF